MTYKSLQKITLDLILLGSKPETQAPVKKFCTISITIVFIILYVINNNTKREVLVTHPGSHVELTTVSLTFIHTITASQNIQVYNGQNMNLRRIKTESKIIQK